MKNLWNDEYGFGVNKFLKELAKVLLIISLLPCVVGLIWWGARNGFYDEDIGAFLGGVVLTIVCFFGAIILFWMSALGKNVAKIRQQGERNEPEKINETDKKTRQQGENNKSEKTNTRFQKLKTMFLEDDIQETYIDNDDE